MLPCAVACRCCYSLSQSAQSASDYIAPLGTQRKPSQETAQHSQKGRPLHKHSHRDSYTSHLSLASNARGLQKKVSSLGTARVAWSTVCLMPSPSHHQHSTTGLHLVRITRGLLSLASFSGQPARGYSVSYSSGSPAATEFASQASVCYLPIVCAKLIRSGQ